MEERSDQFVDQLADRMNDMMNLRRRGDHNVNISEFDEDTLNLKGFINWLVSVEEVFEFKESKCKKAKKRTLFVEPEEWDDDGVTNDNYEEASVFDDDQYEEQDVTRDVRVNLMVRPSYLTLQAVDDDWLKHNIFQATCNI
nr:hypothetical protein [Tanacetum cinerariifolium]